MSAWRFVRDLPEARVRQGQTVELSTSRLKQLAKAGGKQLWQVAVPAELGLHFLERNWGPVHELDSSIERILDPAKVTKSEMLEAQAKLRAARAELERTREGLLSSQLVIGELRRGATIIGFSHETFTSLKLNEQKRDDWCRKLLEAGAVVGRLAEEEAGLQAQVDAPAPVPEALAAELRRGILQVAQYPGLLEYVSAEAGDSKSQALVRYCFPPEANQAYTALRGALTRWAGTMGLVQVSGLQAGDISFQAICGRPEIAALITWGKDRIAADGKNLK